MKKHILSPALSFTRIDGKLGFTLVELIVVVTILAILATIGFVSYSGYLTGVRDTNRIASLTSISDGLELYRTKNDLPDPDEAIDIQVEGVDIAHQGYVGSNVLQTIEYSKAGKDPKDDSYYSYYLTDDKKYYQLMAFLEESDNLDTHNITSTSHAASDYKNRYPKVYGKRLGILTDMNNAPVQEVITGTLNFTGGTTSAYRARFTDTYLLEGSGSILKSVSPVASCKRIKQLKGGARDGVYSINPTGTGAFDVYCDMTTDGGGWTLFYANSANSNMNIKKSFNEHLADMAGINIDDNNFNNFQLYGMLDFSSIYAKEIMLQDIGNWEKNDFSRIKFTNSETVNKLLNSNLDISYDDTCQNIGESFEFKNSNGRTYTLSQMRGLMAHIGFGQCHSSYIVHNSISDVEDYPRDWIYHMNLSLDTHRVRGVGGFNNGDINVVARFFIR